MHWSCLILIKGDFMKAFRCPVCGAKTLIRVFSHVRIPIIHDEENEIRDRYDRHYVGTRIIRDDCCPQCERALTFVDATSYSDYKIFYFIFSIITMVSMFIALRIKDPFLPLIVLGVELTPVIIYSIYQYGFKKKILGPLEYVDGEGINKPIPNARVKIAKAKCIRGYGTYGLKFSTGEHDQKYNEAFLDGLVPAVFLPDQNNDSEFEIYIINKNVLKDDMFFKDAEFLVEDVNGKFITNGSVLKTELEW